MSHSTHSSYVCQSENNTDSWIMHEWMKLILEMDSKALLSEHAFGSELLRHTCTKRHRKRMQYHISRVIRGQAEVSDLHMILRVQEDVDRLQVPVDHSLSNTHYMSVIIWFQRNNRIQSEKWNLLYKRKGIWQVLYL